MAKRIERKDFPKLIEGLRSFSMKMNVEPHFLRFFESGYFPKLPQCCPECGGSKWHRVMLTSLWNCMRCGNVIEEKG